MSVFTPQHKPIKEIFVSDTEYTIPSYQRPYSWESTGKNDKNNQVNTMWDDLLGFFRGTQSTHKDYFLGSMVVIERKEVLTEFEVVDGQQRLTTILLLFAAMKCFLQNQKTAATEELVQDYIEDAMRTLDDILYNKKSLGLKPELKVKIQRMNGSNFDLYLNKAVACEPESCISQINEKQRIIVHRYFKNRDYFIHRLSDEFLTNGRFTLDKAEQFENYAKFLRGQVSIVIIKTEDFDTAYNIFEILNNRGLPLTNKDLFRNFLISEFHKIDRPDPAEQWNYLERNYDLTDEFVSRWMGSRTVSHLKKNAFNALQGMYNGLKIPPGQERINIFYGEVETNLTFYTIINSGADFTDQTEFLAEDANAAIGNKLHFIMQAGNERYSVNLLLALFRSCDYGGDSNPEILHFITEYEKYLLYVMLKPGRRFSVTPVNDAIRDLNDGQFAAARKILQLEPDETKELKSLITGKHTDNSVARFLIAKYIWCLNLKAEFDVVKQQLIYDKATLEHIIPQNPDPKSNWLLDFEESFLKSYTYKLGNMTLLTQKMNSEAKNADFAIKKKYYNKTLLGITKELAQLETIDQTYIKERHNKIVNALYADLGLDEG